MQRLPILINEEKQIFRTVNSINQHSFLTIRVSCIFIFIISIRTLKYKWYTILQIQLFISYLHSYNYSDVSICLPYIWKCFSKYYIYPLWSCIIIYTYSFCLSYNDSLLDIPGIYYMFPVFFLILITSAFVHNVLSSCNVVMPFCI